MSEESAIHGLAGEFRDAQEAVAMARELRLTGFRHFDVYSPAPIPEMEELLSPRPRTELALIMFAAAILGAFIGFFMQWSVSVLAYPINVGGRPLNSWPAYIPITWDVCALFVLVAGFIALLVSTGLPSLYHPIFAAPGFERASQDRFFLCVETEDPLFDQHRLAQIFLQHHAIHVAEVPR